MTMGLLSGIFEKNVTLESQMAFRYFVGVVHSPPVYPEYEKFVVVVNKYLEMPPFNFTNPFNSIGGLKIVSFQHLCVYFRHLLYWSNVQVSIALSKSCIKRHIFLWHSNLCV